MSLILSKEILGHYLSIVEKALSRQPNNPNLGNIYCELESPQISFSATNLELSIKVAFNCEGEGKGKLLIPPKITEIVRSLPQSKAVFDFDPDSYQVDLSSGEAHYSLFGADPTDFPPVEKILPDNKEKIVIDPVRLKEYLKMVVFAASTEETRPAFNGVLFEFDNNRWSLLSSDTYRLVVKNIQDESCNFQNRRCLVPAKVLRELLKIIDQSEEAIELYPSTDQMIFDLGTVYFAARLLNEKYPDVSSAFPDRYLTRIQVNRGGFAEAVGRAALMAEGSNNAVQLSVENGSLAVRVSSQIGRMEEKLVLDNFEGEEVDLYINSRFILDVLRAVPVETIIMDFHGRTGPVIFRLPEDDSYLYLVLPIKMN